MDFLAVSDAFIGEGYFRDAAQLLAAHGHSLDVMHWGPAKKVELENIIRRMEQSGPAFDESVQHIARRLADKQGLLVDFSPVPVELMERLKIIGVCRANTANVDMKSATARRIPVIGVAGRNASAVAEFTIGLMLAESRHIARSHANLMAGRWTKEYGDDPNEIEGKTIGIVGFGSIGQAVARKLTGFGCRIIFYDPYISSDLDGARRVALDELFRESDFVTIHVKMTPETKHMVGEKQLLMMKPTAFLINTARSEIVDQDALVRALRSSTIRGAALDVFVDEPLPPDSPLLRLPNLTLTPHMAGATRESLMKSPLMLVQNVLKYMAGDLDCNLQNRSIRADVPGGSGADVPGGFGADVPGGFPG
jgi:D-3-phosphoglycerate dehydrogenase